MLDVTHPQEFVLGIDKMANVKFYPCIMLYVSEKYHTSLLYVHMSSCKTFFIYTH